jgi:hypothetical protein
VMMWLEKDSDYLAYLPAVYGESIAFERLAAAINPELDEFKAAITGLLANGSLLTADAETLRRYQKFFGIQSAAATEELRCQIMARLRERPPINGQKLAYWLDALTGTIHQISSGVDPFSVVIKYKTETGLDEDYLYSQLQRILPANLMIELIYAFFEWQMVESFSWQEVKNYTWDELRKLSND